MPDAFIYDAVRTPRGKGRKDGSLHEVTPVRLAVTALQAIRDRNKLNTHLVDDVVMGSDGGAWPTDPAVAMPMYFVPQGISADLLATKYGISRDDVDAYAVESQKRAKAAWDAGYFKKSIVPVKDQNGVELLNHDELMRPQTTMQTLAALEPSFKMQGEAMPGFDAVAQQRYPEVEKLIHVHHAGNSSGIVDGAAAILIGSKEFGEKAGLKPRA